MRISLGLLFFFCWQLVSCKSQKNTCQQLINESNYQFNEDTICSKLVELKKEGFALSIYIGDSIPSMVERDDLFHLWVSNIDKRAMFFVNLKNKEFAIIYSTVLKEESYLRTRYSFMHSANNAIKNEDRSEAVLDVIDSFRETFIETRFGSGD